MRYSNSFASLGWMLLICTAAMVVPATIAFLIGEVEAGRAFFGAALISLFVGGASVFSLRGQVRRPDRRDLLLTLVLGWVVVPIFAGMPFLLSGAAGSFADAYFEAVSGLTTTGATIMQDLDALPRSIVLWRAVLQWFGGFATLAAVIAVYPILNIGGMVMFNNQLPHGEGENVIDRIRGVVRATWQVYLLLTLFCMMLLWITGVPFFDGICLAFSTVSSGGFTPRGGSLEVYSSPWTRIVLIPFMIIAALNFTLHRAFLDNRPVVYRRDPEVGRFLVVVAFATVLFTSGLETSLGAGGGKFSLGEGVLTGLFTAVSMVSTTGFVSSDTLSFPLTPALLIMPLILIGGCTGSTAGGLKLMRVWMLTQHGDREFWRLTHPHGVVNKLYSGIPVSDAAIASVWAFFILFVLTLCGVTLALTAAGLDLQSAISAASAALSNTGPSLALMSPDLAGYWAISEFGRWILAFAMILGRLEVLPFLVLLTAIFWRG